ncbi:MAG: hypothetical protein A4E37_00836 [Methanoregulaceae archaeon PtaB.Bin056]|nr:MAG: hypothetical protein A4E37_00836 [Methanoregulaceae archaeon PtaB.Bin056]
MNGVGMKTGGGISWMMVLAVFACLIALSGCISPQEFMAEPGPSPEGTVSPVVTTTPGTPTEGGGIDLLPDAGRGVPQYIIKTPYGYLITTPTSGVRVSVIEIRDDLDATGQRIISGRIKNDENYRIDHITVNFNLYNSNGHLIGNTFASVNSLGPGKVWKFSTQPFSYRDYQYYEMSGIFTA